MASGYLGSTTAKAVDVGCGTGVATLQLATLLKSATVYGVDISSVPDSTKQISPKNIEWVRGNILDTGTRASGSPASTIFAKGNLDYFFGRMLFLGINDWSSYFSVANRSLKQGGIIEHQDLDWAFYSVDTDRRVSDAWGWHKRLMAAVDKSGLSSLSGSNAVPLMEQMGFGVLDVEVFRFSFTASKIPGSQAMGHYVQNKLLPNYPELLRKLYEAVGVSGDELDDLTQACMRDLSETDGIYQKYTVTIGIKK